MGELNTILDIYIEKRVYQLGDDVDEVFNDIYEAVRFILEETDDAYIEIESWMREAKG